LLLKREIKSDFSRKGAKPQRKPLILLVLFFRSARIRVYPRLINNLMLLVG
jgi:hypothetical protein